VAAERLQDRLVRSEVRELKVRAGLVVVVVENVVLVGGGCERSVLRRRDSAAQGVDEVAGNLSDAAGGVHVSQQGLHAVDEGASECEVTTLHRIRTRYECVNESYPGVFFDRGYHPQLAVRIRGQIG